MAPALLSFFALGQVLLPEPIAALERPLRPPLSNEIGFVYRLGRTAPNGTEVLGQSLTREGLMLHLRFAAEVTPVQVKAIAAHGCRLQTSPDGVRAIVGPIADAFCRWDALNTLYEIDGLTRVEPTRGGKILRPMLPKSTTLDVAGITRTIERTWPARSGGAGITIGDMDSGFDPFHPLHFRADGGRFAWLDVNSDGVFEPGVDAVDFNHNGMVDPGETLRVLKPTFYSEYTFQQFDSPGAFTPGVDWLYQDENDNLMRDYGKQFTDAKLTFGEQLFVADDVDGNGTLDLGEPVVALATPKVRALLTRTHVYRRGVDLSQYPVPDEQHANMVVGTLVGGDTRLTRYAGAAPDADVVLAENDEDMLVMVAAWAQNEGAQIMLWEMANWFLEFLDGSSPHEVACDSLTDAGVLQIAAAGNLGTSEKHLELGVPSAMTLDLPITVPAATPSSLYSTLLWKNAGEVDFSLTWGTTTVMLTGASGQAAVGPTTVVWGFDSSPRGTHKLDVYIPLGTRRPAGALKITVGNQTGSELFLRGYLEDQESGWGLGVAWSGPGVTDTSTYGTPAVGDTTLAVGTFLIDWPYMTPSGQLAYYSSLGPRSDGFDTIDFATPEDHWTAPYSRTTSEGAVPPFGSYFVGAGTSDALPMATGVATVLMSANPTWKAAELTHAMHLGAQPDVFTGPVPNDKWGYGKLSAYRALTGSDPTDALPPIARGTVERHGELMLFDATSSLDPNGSALQYRWDVGDDGEFEIPANPMPMAQLTNGPAGEWVRLEVEDPTGLVGARIIRVSEFPLIVDPFVDSPAVLGNAAKTGCGCGAGDAPWLMLAAAMLLARRRVTAT